MTQTTIEGVRAVFTEFFGPSQLIAVGDHGHLWVDHGSGQPRCRADLDSLDRVEFIMALEEHFEVMIPDDVADGCTTIAGTAEAIEQLLAAKQAARHEPAQF
ncbi:MAG: hypothetical protein K2X76_11860 [Sphingomonas sp.]|nr:hypothetical protein [Sphingomonas sp.]